MTTVLVCEDNEDIVLLLTHVFRRAGIEMRSAGSVEKAWAALSTEDAPDALVMDVVLPDDDGWELLKRIRASKPLRALPVIVLTGDVRPEIRARAEELSAIFMGKPFSTDDLVETVQRAGRSASTG